MLRPVYFLALTSFALFADGQQIWDIWSTTWDRSKLLTYTGLKTPINFGAPNVIGSADINILDTQTYQTVWGFGGSLTDSSALVMSQLKSTNSGNYWKLLSAVFNSTDGANSGGLNYLRVPLGASDFSSGVYSFDDVWDETSLNSFNINRAPSYLFQTILDIKSINPLVKVHLLPWSPPGWMKDSGKTNGGSFKTNYVNTYANYLLKSLQGFKSKGITAYAIGIQNEPQNSNPTYPTAKFTYSQEGQVALALRSLMNNNGFGDTVIIGYEHNWDNAGDYPIKLMQSYGSAYYGVAFHCYGGSVANQDIFHAAYPDKGIFFTECTGTVGSDWWSDIKWYMDNLFIGSIHHNAHAALMWNIAARGDGEPRLPGTNSCGNGCRGIVTVNTDGTWSVNQEYYAMSQTSKAILPRDNGGPWGKRVGVTIGGSQSWALRVGAFVTKRKNPADWDRWSIVVLNWNDNASGGWNPKPVLTTIEFRGKQATYTFPVGVTTLWWYAPPSGNVVNNTKSSNKTFDDGLYVQGQQVPLHK